MAVHGVPRATIDIDLLVPASAIDAAFVTAKSQGYWLEPLPMQFQRGAIEIRGISKTDDETGAALSLDLLVVTPQILEVWNGRTQRTLNGAVLPVVSREGLIALKTLSGRTQDLADIERLNAQEVEDAGAERES